MANKQNKKQELKRMWINQPSKLQPFHHLNGTNVLAYREHGDTYRVYFLSGDIISQQMPGLALSDGWIQTKQGEMPTTTTN